MNLKKRMLIAFFTIITVPVFLTLVALWGCAQYQMKSIERTYGIKKYDYEYIANSIYILSQLTNDIYQKLVYTMDQEPERFQDSGYLRELNGKLQQERSYLMIRRDEELAYVGTDRDIGPLIPLLPEYGASSGMADGGQYLGGEIQVLVKQVDFQFPDGAAGSAFIVTPVEKPLPEIRDLAVDMVFAMVFILIFTSAFLTAWIYRGIVTPLNRLKKAAQNIKAGNLDFAIEADTQDEIGELFSDFEEMRQRLKLSAEEKMEYDRESRELLSNISHDLKTPITAVKGYVEGIMDGVADTPEKMEKYIKTIYNKANEMDALINELTFYSKIDTNRIPYTFSRINVSAYFNDCSEELSMELEEKNIALSYSNDVEKDVMIIADAEQLTRVIHNIVGNSVKYIDKPQGVINIRIKDAGDFIQVEIEDNGKGIGQKDLQYIFDRFYRTDASRNSAQGGSGIGLSICRKILEDHGGRIWASSREGEGTVIYFVIRKYQEVKADEQDIDC